MKIEPVSFHPGEMFIQSGTDHHKTVFLVETGSAVARVEGVLVKSGTLGPGEIVGEMGPLTNQKRSATVTAGPHGMTGVKIMEEKDGELHAILDITENSLAMQLILQLSERLRQTNKELAEARRSCSEKDRQIRTMQKSADMVLKDHIGA